MKMKEIKGVGVGIDIEEISRFKKLDRLKNKSFLEKVYTENELNYCFSKKNAAQHLAARYAGKEAVIKSLTSIGKTKCKYNEIEIFNNENGLPLVRLSDKKLSDIKVKISLSHCKQISAAFVIVIGGASYEND